MTAGAGYSKNPLVVKLGLTGGMRARFVNPPAHYFDLLGPLPDNVTVLKAARTPIDFIHLFTTTRKDLLKQLSKLKPALAADGMLWVSWPKGGSSIKGDLREDAIREAALEAGLVDVKVCAVDADWSGLKLVYRLKDRK